ENTAHFRRVHHRMNRYLYIRTTTPGPRPYRAAPTRPPPAPPTTPPPPPHTPPPPHHLPSRRAPCAMPRPAFARSDGAAPRQGQRVGAAGPGRRRGDPGPHAAAPHPRVPGRRVPRGGAAPSPPRGGAVPAGLPHRPRHPARPCPATRGVGRDRRLPRRRPA